jgi:hypothetical protein
VVVEIERTREGCNVATRTRDGMVDIVLWCDEPVLEEIVRGTERWFDAK